MTKGKRKYWLFSSTSSFFARICVCRAHLLVRTHINCVWVCVYTILRLGDRVCVYVRVNVFVHYSWVSEFHLSSHLFNKKKVPTCTWMHSSAPTPFLCDFSWQFVSLNVWWHVHLLLLYMCITGYKGVFEHSKHVHFSFSLLSLVETFFSRLFQLFLLHHQTPKANKRFSILPLFFGAFWYFWWAVRKRGLCSLLLLLMKSSLFTYDSINTFFFVTFSNKEE